MIKSQNIKFKTRLKINNIINNIIDMLNSHYTQRGITIDKMQYISKSDVVSIIGKLRREYENLINKLEE